MGAPAAMAGVGALGNFLGARQANKPKTTKSSQTSTQKTTPYGGGGLLDQYLGLSGYGLGYGLANSPYGPSEGMNALSSAIRNRALSRGSGGGGGGGSSSGGTYMGRNVGGGGTGITPVGMSPEQIANYLPQMNPYMQSLLEGQYLPGQDGAGNPYLQGVLDNNRRDMWESYGETILPEIDARFARAGRVGPTSQAYGQATGNAYEDFGDAINAQAMQARYQDYANERQNMMQALGLYSGETNASRGNLGQMRNTDVQSATAIRTATIAANAAIEQARIAASMQGRALSLQEEQMIFNQQLAAYGVEQSQLAAQSQGALTPMNLIGQYGQQILGPLAQFGSTTSNTSGTNIAPGAGINTLGAGLLGGLGGYMSGYGMQNPQSNQNQAPSLANMFFPIGGTPIFGRR